MRHLENMAKVMLATGLIVGYGYVIEAFMAWYSANPYETFMIANRMRGPYAPVYWALILCNVVAPQLLWFQRVRSNARGAVRASRSSSTIGMWLERFVIIVDEPAPRLPAVVVGDVLARPVWDWATFIGTIGLFLALLFLFIRFLPMISIFEMRTLVPEARPLGKEAGPRRIGAEDDGSRRSGGRDLGAARGVRDARATSSRRRARAREVGYRPHGRVHAVPDPRPLRRDGLPPDEAAARRAGGRPHRRARRRSA